MKKLKFFLALFFVVLFAVMGYMFFAEHTVSMTEQEVQQSLAQRMPQKKTFLKVFEVTLDHPQVMLNGANQRIHVKVDVNVSVGGFILLGQSVAGVADLSSGIRYDAAQGAFFLTDPVIDQLEIENLPVKELQEVNEVLKKMLIEYYATRPVYTLSNKMAYARHVLKEVKVGDHELILTLGR